MPVVLFSGALPGRITAYGAAAEVRSYTPVPPALLSVGAGFVGAVALTLLLAVLMPLVDESMVLAVSAAQLTRLEPATIVRRG